MVTLSIDTATEHGTIAVASGDDVLASTSWRSSARHGENLFGRLDEVLRGARVVRSDLSWVAASVGPGKFTSLRVGLSTAKGIALGLDIPIVGVGSLPVLARTGRREHANVTVPLMNAYRGDVFGAAYEWSGDSIEEVVSPTFGPPADVLARIRAALGDRAVTVYGEGASSNAELVADEFGLDSATIAQAPVAPDPIALAREANHVFRSRGPDDLAGLEPRYLRPSDATLPDRPLRSLD
ncbi:MAG: tRNA (adenosine(37)-N6)-threonylcarbamoyltransferase complex dimerization subunit type 1 TsaB [Polyangiales bacterium]